MPLPPGFADFEAEMALTRKMLAAFPEAHAAWQPHAKSRTLAQLASHVAGLPQLGASILTTELRDVTKQAPPRVRETTAELISAFDAAVVPLRDALATADSAALAGVWSLRAGDKVLVQGTRGEMLRIVALSHMIHHRAQLGVYYRLLGVPVPGTYGPSADESLPA